mgnify:CR=1 FL=1
MSATRVSPTDLPELSLTVSRNGQGPAVVLLHGFPEIAYSWRHQIPVLGEAGYQVSAPDQRGYGWSDQPDGVEAYSMTELVGDVIALLDHDNIDDAVIVGHDWGAIIAPWVGLFRPDRVRGLALLSVPYSPRGERSIVDHIRATDPEGDFAYMLAFQEEGIEEVLQKLAELKDNVKLWWRDEATAQQDYNSGEVAIGQFYHDITAFAASVGEPLRSVFPDEGAVGDSGSWGITKTTESPEACIAFIDWFSQPSIQERLATTLGTSPTVSSEHLGLTEADYEAVAGPGPDAAITPVYSAYQEREDWINQRWSEVIFSG